MAKNFASVLDSLRAAGEDRLQEVDSVYTLNCDWLLEQFKLSQTSLAALRPTSHATVNDVKEQQNTAKAHGRRSQQKSKSANTATETVQQKQLSDAEAQSSEHAASPAEKPAAPLAHVLRSRRGQANAAPATSAQGSAASKQFSSPPKTRAGRKRNQAATKSAAVSASTRKGMKAAHQQAEASHEPDDARHAEEHAHQETVDTEAISLPEPPHSNDVQKPHSPGPVLVTSDSLQQEIQIGPDSHFTQDNRPCAEAPADSPTAPVEVLPKLVAEEQTHTSELAGASMSKRRKRKQSAVGESLLAFDWHTNTAKLRQPDSPVAGSPAVEHEQSATLQTAPDPNDRDEDDLEADQPQESLTPADSMDASSPPATDQPGASPLVHPQPSAMSPVDPVLESSPAPAADANTVVPASPVNAWNSDYQDAQERLSSPLRASPALARSEGEQPAEPSVHMLHEDADQAAAAASPSPSSPEDQVAQASGRSLGALKEAQASPAHVATDPDPDTSVAAAGVEVAGSAAIADAPDADSSTVLQTSMASALGAAAAVPLPAAAGTQGDGPDRQPSSSDATAANGLAGNLVSAIRSFLPGGKPPEPHLAHGKKPVKVKALEAADAARRKEAAKNADRIKQKGTLDKQRAERAKAKQEEEQQKAQEDAKKRQEAIRKRDEEAAQRRRAKEEAERKERQERQQKAEASRAKKKADEVKKKEPERTVPRQAEAQSSRAPLQVQSSNVQAPAMAQAVLASSKPVHPPAGPSIARLPLHQQPQVASGLAQASAPSAPAALAALQPAALQPAAPQQFQAQPAAAAPQTQGRQITKPGVPEADTYQISPYRGDESDAESSEDDDPKKPIPEWARGRALMQQLASQVQTDPDEVFQQHRKTCSLDEVFGHSDTDKNNKQKKDLSRRSSSGNWIEDRVTWKEELNYKKAMGYM